MKRFTETNIWDEDWFMDIPIEYKLFWFYLKDKCNHAGIWRPNLRLFEVMVGVKIDLKKALGIFNKDKIRCEILKSGHWFILDFFVFQYGSVMNLSNRVHKSIQDIYIQEDINLTSIRGLLDHKDGVKDKDKDKEKDKEENIKYVIENVIEYLNNKTGKNFKSNSKPTIKHINARIAENFTLEQFKKVIDIKVSKWLNNPEMVDYLRPETLFGTKFESYLNEKQNNGTDQKHSIKVPEGLGTGTYLR